MGNAALGKGTTVSIVVEHLCSAKEPRDGKNNLTDYLTGYESGKHAVHKVSEVCLQLLGKFEATLENRMSYTELYKEYHKTRKAIKIKKVHHDCRDGSISVDTGNPIGFGSR